MLWREGQSPCSILLESLFYLSTIKHDYWFNTAGTDLNDTKASESEAIDSSILARAFGQLSYTVCQIGRSSATVFFFFFYMSYVVHPFHQNQSFGVCNTQG